MASSLVIMFFIFVSFPFIMRDLDQYKYCAQNVNLIPNRTLYLLPTFCFAFSFESSVLPLSNISKVRDDNGQRSFKACIYTLLYIFLFYFILMMNSLIYGTELEGKCPGKLDQPIMNIVFIASQETPASNYLACFLIICILIQSILQLFYTFFESRNHLYLLLEELLYYETSNYVEETKRSNNVVFRDTYSGRISHTNFGSSIL